MEYALRVLNACIKCNMTYDKDVLILVLMEYALRVYS
jgi:hypothetical protein